ncbi:benzoate/H(+) symporter BenE family transporter [Azohydromonas caseinilytica]|uniref:Benzoate/H(+) symporter BenE family transporter n=1 Tax=Azohydromonas caseinilytica TaxID=2728836 RepID=A0A848FG10_9BURK|nr:benzoate/H(+) symporter BenE family transporter [Azohydromonas caseinilytica]NML18076.1 benzoate/H(+) symporter BenE family transporter [Azohydromonas caseinilytica]
MLRRDWSVSAATAGFLAVLISYAGPLLIFFQAARAAHAPPEMIASWVLGISLGAAVSGIALSWWLKVPVITAWSAPGTALLITLFPSLSLHEAVGAYLTAAGLIFLIGITGTFDRLTQRIPKGVCYGMMAGILFQFGAGAFKAVQTMPLLTLCMVAGYLVAKRCWPRYHLVIVLALGVALTAALGRFEWQGVSFSLARPVLIAPSWSWASTLSLALPLVIVSLTGQFLPGMAILRSAGYGTPAKPILAATSVASALVAPLGGITIVLAAITAALCTGRESHEDPGRRYVAGIANGVFYLVGGCLGGSLIGLLAALPAEFVAVLAGLALIGAITANVLGAASDPEHREAAIITFLATASGMSFMGLGSAFWGVVIGAGAHAVLGWKRAPSAAAPATAPARGAVSR